MGLASTMRERITLQRLVEDPNGSTKTWTDLTTVWAEVSPEGQAAYSFRIRFRDDIRSRTDTEPAMRVIFRGVELDLTDIIETARGAELQLIASRRTVENIEDLASGARRIATWP